MLRILLVALSGATLVVACVGCGRLGFGSTPGDVDASLDVGPDDGAAVTDTAPDSATDDDAATSDDGGSDASAEDGGGVDAGTSGRPDTCPPRPIPCRDETFGGAGGSTLIELGTTMPGFLVDALARRGTGYVVVGAIGTDGARDVAIIGLDRDGRVDPSFGASGRRVVDLAGGDDSPHSVTRAPDGALYVSAKSNNVAYVIKLTPIGDLDTRYGGGDGIATVDFAPGSDSANGISVGADGRVVVGGQGHWGSATNFDFTSARLLADGSAFDATYGMGGVQNWDFSGADEFGALFGSAGSGYLIAGSSFAGATGFDCAFVRLDAMGSPVVGDRHDVSGAVDRCPFARAAPSTGYVAAGYATFATTDQLVMRLADDLTLDTRFGTGGVVTLDTRGQNDQGRALALSPSGVIIVGGWTNAPTGDVATLWTLDTDGRTDTSRLVLLDAGDPASSHRVTSLLTDTESSVMALIVETSATSSALIVQRYWL